MRVIWCWVAAFSKVSLVADSVGHEANCSRDNSKRAFSLFTSILVTNSSDNQTFGELFKLLFSCLHLRDARGRNMMHHTTLTAGISDPKRPFVTIQTLRASKLRCKGAFGANVFFEELMDSRNTNGDTTLKASSLMDFKYIANQLFEIENSENLPNYEELCHADFGIDDKCATSDIIQKRHLVNNKTARGI